MIVVVVIAAGGCSSQRGPQHGAAHEQDRQQDQQAVAGAALDVPGNIHINGFTALFVAHGGHGLGRRLFLLAARHKILTHDLAFQIPPRRLQPTRILIRKVVKGGNETGHGARAHRQQRDEQQRRHSEKTQRHSHGIHPVNVKPVGTYKAAFRRFPPSP